MTSRPELTDALFVDLTNDMVRNKHNRQLLDRASALMSEGHQAPVAWYAAMREAGVGISEEQTARLREYMLLGDQSKAAKPGPFARGRTSAGAPDDVPHATDEESLPRTPVVQAARVAAVARGDRDRGSGLLADNNGLAEAAAAWQAQEQRRTGRKPSWKESLLAASKQASKVDAAESPVSSAQQPKPVSIQKAIATATTQSIAGPLTSGYRWSPAGGWTLEQQDPFVAARQAAMATAARIPAAAPDQRRTDVQSPSMRLAEVAHDRMAGKGQSIDPKSKNYLTDLKAALLEVAET